MQHKPLINAYICAILILVVCLLPGSSLPKVSENWLPLDKLVHIIMYVPMTWTLAYGFKCQTKWNNGAQRFLLYAFIVSCVYGALIELLQFALTPDRACELFDFFADALGAAIGVFSYNLGERLINIWNGWFTKRVS